MNELILLGAGIFPLGCAERLLLVVLVLLLEEGRALLLPLPLLFLSLPWLLLWGGKRVLACLPCLPASCCQLLPPKPPLVPCLSCVCGMYRHTESHETWSVHASLLSLRPPDIMRQPWHTLQHKNKPPQQAANQSPLSHAPRPAHHPQHRPPRSDGRHPSLGGVCAAKRWVGWGCGARGPHGSTRGGLLVVSERGGILQSLHASVWCVLSCITDRSRRRLAS